MAEHAEKWRLAAEDWADKKTAADLLTETKNDVLAEIEASIDAKTKAEKERQARLSDRWKEFRGKMLEAQAAERKAKVYKDYMSMRFNEWQTKNANYRQEKYMSR